MKYHIEETKVGKIPCVRVMNIDDFDLDHIFDCGQCFRWKRVSSEEYEGVALGRSVKMIFKREEAAGEEDLLKLTDKQCRGTLEIINSTREDFENLWYDYLDLGRDYGEIKRELIEKDRVMGEAISYGRGIRILRQDLWETIISFIISQNNNIPRIKGCIENLSKLFGEDVLGYDGNVYRSLPSAERLAGLSVEDLAPVRLGYRAKYLVETGRQIAERGLPQGPEELSDLMGVGPKVANCISLFGMNRLDSFPVDVWMGRVMNRLYGIEENNRKAMMDYAKEHFGNLGGIAQQYLFYYIRQVDKNKA